MNKQNYVWLTVLCIACIAVGVMLRPISNRIDSFLPSGTGSGSRDAGPVLTFDDLLDAIEWVESKGDAWAVGKDGEVGAYQIKKIYVDDVNRILSADGKSGRFAYRDRLNKVHSRTMTRIYVCHYSYLTVAWTRKRVEEMARIHNGGPDGWRNDPHWFVRNRDCTLEQAKRKIANTKAYWEKVKARMEAK